MPSRTPPVLVNGSERYTIKGALGETPHARIFYALDRDGEPVAIKVIHKTKIYDMDKGLDHVAAEQRIMRLVTEIEKPFLVQLLASWEDDANVYFVMRLYCESLISRTERKPLNHTELEIAVAEMISALSSLHAADIMHRDIKPDNIFISPSGHIALGDFGLSASRSDMDEEDYADDDDELAFSDLVGTPGYVAPEMVMYTPEKTYGKAADVWSLGVTILETALGMTESFYSEKSREALIEEMLERDLPIDEVDDPALRDLLTKMLCHSPQKRPSAAELKWHRFFRGLNWATLDLGGYQAIRDTRYTPFDPSFTNARTFSCCDGGSPCYDEDLRMCFLAYRCPDEIRFYQDYLHGADMLPLPYETVDSGEQLVSFSVTARNEDIDTVKSKDGLSSLCANVDIRLRLW